MNYNDNFVYKTKEVVYFILDNYNFNLHNIIYGKDYINYTKINRTRYFYKDKKENYHWNIDYTVKSYFKLQFKINIRDDDLVYECVNILIFPNSKWEERFSKKELAYESERNSLLFNRYGCIKSKQEWASDFELKNRYELTTYHISLHFLSECLRISYSDLNATDCIPLRQINICKAIKKFLIRKKVF